MSIVHYVPLKKQALFFALLLCIYDTIIAGYSQIVKCIWDVLTAHSLYLPAISRYTQAMIRQMISLRLWIALLLLGLTAPTVHARQDASLAEITNPITGANLIGEVTVAGSASHPQFARYTVEFAFDPNPTDTWFPLSTGVQPVTDGVLAVWNTTGITPGQYMLRLQVFSTDGSAPPLETTVTGLVIPDPAASPPTATAVVMPPTATSAVQLPPTRTPAPTTTPDLVPTVDLPPGGDTAGDAGEGGSGDGDLLGGIDLTDPESVVDSLAVEFDAQPFVDSFFSGMLTAISFFILMVVYTILRTYLRGPIRKWLRRTISDLRRP